MPLAGSAATHRYTATVHHSGAPTARLPQAGVLMPVSCFAPMPATAAVGPSATLVLCQKCLAKYGWQSVPADSAVGMDVFSA